MILITDYELLMFSTGGLFPTQQQIQDMARELHSIRLAQYNPSSLVLPEKGQEAK